MQQVIAIGALGGSGTRAVAQVLIEAGIYMGDYLNKPRDNLAFTRLFKDLDFHRSTDEAGIRQRLAVFERYMAGKRLPLHDANILLNTTINGLTLKRRFKFYRRLLKKTLLPQPRRDIWGWKEPNTHIYLEQIDAYFPRFKYMHVIRHGLDMAFSNNKMQLFNWGPKYGIELGANMPAEEESYKQLEYWVRSTRDVLRKAENIRGDFLLINHSRLCENPKGQVDTIIDFIGLQPEDETRQRMYSIPRTPRTAGRYRKHDLGIFDQAQIDFVREMGFEVKT